MFRPSYVVSFCLWVSPLSLSGLVCGPFLVHRKYQCLSCWNGGPLGMWQGHNLGCKSRLNFPQKGKADKWEAVGSHGPSFRGKKTFWIISNLQAITTHVLLCLTFLHFSSSIIFTYRWRTQPYISSVLTIGPWDWSPFIGINCCCCYFNVIHLLPVGSTEVPFIINLIPASCAVGNCNFKV